MAGMGHQKVADKISCKCPHCGKEMTKAIKMPGRKSIWFCPCGTEFMHVEAVNKGLVKIERAG